MITKKDLKRTERTLEYYISLEFMEHFKPWQTILFFIFSFLIWVLVVMWFISMHGAEALMGGKYG